MDKIEVLRQRIRSINNKRVSDLSYGFKDMKDELETHLIVINENAFEMQSYYELVKHINQKIEKLNERINIIQSMLGK